MEEVVICENWWGKREEGGLEGFVMVAEVWSRRGWPAGVKSMVVMAG